ncbi:hypothetical protein OG689_35835 [Kitasatospora sp. NBC_00240]|uniref:DUF7489 domain-containing protein n=1 Tax=Kitasatospora sp. NBC_00240 TaxID=2903567 RepID=UPI00224FE1E4|nr:hypothetical protein [Kitasatospora sp. NBC_00240]MCX5214570.1 hypothetical protein [Kitasatospora sp. NBC_00240]
MSSTVFLILALGPLVLVLAVIAVQRANAVDDAYTGEVTARWVSSSTGTYGTTTRCMMRIRTDEGQELAVAVDGRTYNALGVGDRVVKTPGARWPVRSG